MNSRLLSRLIPAMAAATLMAGGAALSHADDHGSSIRMIDPSRFNIDQQEISAIRERMQAAVEGDHIAGALLLVGNEDGIGMLETVGTQGPGDDREVDAQTIFRIYSMTKPIISVAAMDLVEDGLLNVEDPVGMYIPEFTELEVFNPDTGEVAPAQNTMTIEHLLTHESGIIQGIFSMDTELGQRYLSEIPSDGSITALELAQRIGDMPLFFEPGTKWHYGHSTDVLGAVLEVAADKPLDELLNERIFEPLGMDETTFYVPESESHRVAEPIHGEMADNTIARPLLSGGGGLNSTTEDYIRFAEMLLNGGEYEGARILEPETLARMLEPKIGDEVSRDYFFYGERGDWSMGFHLQPVENNSQPYNFGWRGIGGTLFVVDPANEFFMIYMEQKRGGPQNAPFNNNVAQRVVYEAIAD